MFWNKKENENEKTEKVETPQDTGRPYKFRHVKYYAIPETLFENKRPCRKIFEQDEITYLNWEVVLVNKKFDEADWTAKLSSRCYKVDEGRKEMCNINENISVTKDIDTYYYRYSWGTDNPGYWRAGVYTWEIYIDDELAGTDTMFIYNYGMVTRDNNPYFEFVGIKMYPAYFDYRESKEGYRYVTQFDTKITEYAGVELEVKVKIPAAFNFEIRYVVIKEDGTPKTQFFNESSFVAGDAGRGMFIRYGWGTQQPGYWKKGNYTIHSYFMDVLIASAAFSVGDEEIAGIPSTLSYNESLNKSKPNIITPEVKKTTEELCNRYGRRSACRYL